MAFLDAILDGAQSRIANGGSGRKEQIGFALLRRVCPTVKRSGLPKWKREWTKGGRKAQGSE